MKEVFKCDYCNKRIFVSIIKKGNLAEQFLYNKIC